MFVQFLVRIHRLKCFFLFLLLGGWPEEGGKNVNHWGPGGLGGLGSK